MKKLIVSLSMLAATTAVFGQTTNQEEFKTIVATLEKGWNTRSGETFASVFANNHDYIVWTGVFLPDMTAKDNGEAHQNIFNYKYPDTDLQLKLAKVRMVRQDIAILHVLGATYPTGGELPKDPAIIISMVMEKTDKGWKAISFHNCDIEISFEPGAPAQGGPPANIMYAAWYK